MPIIKTPETRKEAVDLVVKALITRNNHHTMHDGPNVVQLHALHKLFEKSPDPELVTDFEKIVKEGAMTFAIMGFVPVDSTRVDTKAMTLTIDVNDPGSSK